MHSGLLYLFWNNSLSNGIRYATFDGKGWTEPTDVAPPGTGLGTSQYTSSAVIEFLGKIYLFYNGSGSDGTWMTTFKDGSWSQIVPLSPLIEKMSFLPRTSPAVVLSDGSLGLTLMWVGNADGNVWYTSTVDGNSWINPAICMHDVIGGQGLLKYSSPSGVIFNAVEYVFWVGSNVDGIWFTRGKTINLDNGDVSLSEVALSQLVDFTIIVTDQATVEFFKSHMKLDPTPLPGLEGNEVATKKTQDANYADAFQGLLGTDPKFVGKIAASVVVVTMTAILKGYEFAYSTAGVDIRFSCKRTAPRSGRK